MFCFVFPRNSIEKLLELWSKVYRLLIMLAANLGSAVQLVVDLEIRNKLAYKNRGIFPNGFKYTLGPNSIWRGQNLCKKILRNHSVER